MTIIAFISQKGGVGKSTLVQALTTETKKQKISVPLVNCGNNKKLYNMLYYAYENKRELK